MPAPLSPRSIDALLALGAHTLDDSELKQALVDVERSRARLSGKAAELIGELDQRGCFTDDGAVSAKTWLTHHTGLAGAVAGGQVLLAKRLRRMPRMADALAAGVVTEAHARSLGRGLNARTLEAFARDEEFLVAKATELDADSFELVVLHWLKVNDPDGPDPGTERPSHLQVSPMFGGRHCLDGELDLEDSAELLAELEVIHDELWRADQAAPDDDPLKHGSRAERNAAALVEMARRSSAAGDRDSDPDDLDDGQPVSIRPRPRRPQLVVVVDPDALAGHPTGAAELDNGTPLPQSILQRWACDSGIGRVVMTGRSIPFDLGRVTYPASPAQHRALVARDRGCIVDGCKRKPRWCDAHHVVPWPTGPTNLDNLVLVCKRHHKQVHAKIIDLARDPDTGRWTAVRPDGTSLRQRPPPTLAA